MDPDVPLVVPEVNADDIKWHKGIIANPNCSTIQMVVVLKPIHDAAKIERIVVSTYQAVSGAGIKALTEMRDQITAVLENREPVCKVFPHPIAFNCIPHIDAFLPDGYTKEEQKMVRETRKILEDETIQVSATTVRVPVYAGHAESVNVEFASPMPATRAREILSGAPGVIVIDDPSVPDYPTPVLAAGTDETYVGRIRDDLTVAHGLNLWVVADNVRKGAATNAVQIAERAIEAGLVTPKA